ncbi:uncharacterized protein LOC124368982 [Homalodisca vitripennis]|uniref:uncharacterized protein LOC124368982 n=1 Tax=Homalodisca vitripennis TaxID=197043 RepID=UPI001EEAC9F1|nr:uncharacterized protein LOC124368982 [Homalodisca vitripennis]
MSKGCILIGRYTDSEILAHFSVGFFMYYGVIWLLSFLAQIPVFLTHNKPVFNEFNLLIMIQCLVITYVIVSLFEGPCSRMVIAYVSNAPDEEKNLIFFLFGTNLTPRRTCSVSESFRLDTGRRNSRAFMQIIRTSTIMRRKARQARRRLESRRKTEEAAAIAAAQAADSRAQMAIRRAKHVGAPRLTKRFRKRTSAQPRPVRLSQIDFVSTTDIQDPQPGPSSQVSQMDFVSTTDIQDPQPGPSSQVERIPPLDEE